MSVFSNMLYGLLQLVYPRLCIVCNASLHRSEEEICLNCESQLSRYEWGILKEHPMKRALYGRIPAQFSWAFLNFRRHSDVQKILHDIKYKGNKNLARHMGKLMGADFLQNAGNAPIDAALIPVPLHPRKKHIRGFNQSLLLAEGFSAVTEYPILDEVLERVVYSSTQTKKGRMDRWENMKGSFSVRNPAPIEGKHLILLDDVFTTGATVEACWLELQKHNPADVSVCCLAYTE